VDALSLQYFLHPCQSNCCSHCYWDRGKGANSRKQAAFVPRCDWASEPEQIKNKLYITSGEYAGNVCDTVKSADYQIIYQGDDGKEESIIRLRHYENEDNTREEIIAIDHSLTELVENGDYLVGVTKSDAKKLN
jgi:hypothetical protein